jgi:predicted ATP-dependent endonuclease of OLD family
LEELRIEIANIKNVHKARLSLPVEAGLYAIVGENATGKSTIMLALSQLVRGVIFISIG